MRLVLTPVAILLISLSEPKHNAPPIMRQFEFVQGFFYRQQHTNGALPLCRRPSEPQRHLRPQRPTPIQATGSAGPSAGSAGPSFKATLVHFQSYKLPPEGFDSAVDFVDQLDLEGDGVAEVFVQEHGFDAYGYSIYKKTNRGWRQVYTTTGDAC